MSGVPQRAAGVSVPETRGESRGAATLQPVIYERRNGEVLRFASVEDFRLWLDDEQRRETLAEEIAGRT